MADEKKEMENLEEDFADFEDAETQDLPKLEEDLMDEADKKALKKEKAALEELKEPVQEETEIIQEELNKKTEASLNADFADYGENIDDLNHDFSHMFENEDQLEEIQKKLMAQCAEQGFDEANQLGGFNPWQEEEDDEDSAVKKYILYISRDFVPYIDELTTDERSAFINDCIQTKLDLENVEKQKEKKKEIAKHFMVLILTICLSAPIILFCVHKTIMATFDNYKYSQESFEKLYKQRFAKDKAYMRSVQYNRQIKSKNTTSH